MSPRRRRLHGGRLLLASHNAGKLTELEALLAPFAISLESAADHGLPEPEETGKTFFANAELKARAAMAATGLIVLADDSGLAVDALDGEPGIYSARWAEPGRDFGRAMGRVWSALEARGATNRPAARFIAALVLIWPDGHEERFLGQTDGHLVWPPRGLHGFGYDPMFVPAGHDRTFGEMPAGDKLSLSHRARALRQLIDDCLG